MICANADVTGSAINKMKIKRFMADPCFCNTQDRPVDRGWDSSAELRAHCKDLGHVPLIDHNPRGGEKIEFDPAEAMRYNERTVAERMNARLKDEFGGNHIWVKGNTKVMSHLMFGLLVLTVDQLMRLLQ